MLSLIIRNWEQCQNASFHNSEIGISVNLGNVFWATVLENFMIMVDRCCPFVWALSRTYLLVCSASVTKLGMVACHHEQECHVKTFATIKVKATGLYNQNMVKNKTCSRGRAHCKILCKYCIFGCHTHFGHITASPYAKWLNTKLWLTGGCCVTQH